MPTLLVLPPRWARLGSKSPKAAAPLHCHASIHSSSKHLYLDEVFSAWLLLSLKTKQTNKKKSRGNFFWPLGKKPQCFPFKSKWRIGNPVKRRTTEQKSIFFSFCYIAQTWMHTHCKYLPPNFQTGNTLLLFLCIRSTSPPDLTLIFSIFQQFQT